MTRSDDQPHDPGERPAPRPDPGHRARAYAATLIGQLTGGGPLPAEPPVADATAPHAADPADPARPPLTADAPDPLPVDSTRPTVATGPQDQPHDQPHDQPQDQPRDTGQPPPASSTQSGQAGQGRPAAAPGWARTRDEPAAEPAATPGAFPVDVSPTRPGDPASPPFLGAAGSAGAVDVTRPPGGKGGVRPAPFAYVAVALHHTSAARGTAEQALDSAGSRIHGRADRAQARHAALVAVEAIGLLEACDLLEARAQAVDDSWIGERHAGPHLQEFDAAWARFYDASSALEQRSSAVPRPPAG